LDSFRFLTWYWFVLAPIVIAIGWLRLRSRRRESVIFSSVADLKQLPVTLMQRFKRLMPAVYGIGLGLIIVALARPQSGKSESRVTGEGIAIEMVLDISGSMEAVDFQLDGKDVNRLTAVQHVISEFVLGSRASGLPGRKDDFIGVVAFGGFADSKCPLTLDHGALVDIVRSLEVPKRVRDRNGRVINDQTLQEDLATAIGDGLALGLDRLRGAKAKSKVVVLLTDGDSNAGAVDPREAAKIAAELGIKVYPIGIGRTGVVPFPQEDEFGKQYFVRAQFRIDEELLKEIAATSGGEYFHASDSAGLAKVYAQIDRMEKSNFTESKYSEYTELFPWFAVPGLGIALAVGLLNETRFRSI
jgi:Ca-activated chloride channel family protein